MEIPPYPPDDLGLTFEEYAKAAALTNMCPNFNHYDGVPIYEVLALCGEAGEAANKVKKVCRDLGPDVFPGSERTEIAQELGDVLWYVNAAAVKMGFTLEEIAEMNINKLRGRHVRGTLHGSGDVR